MEAPCPECGALPISGEDCRARYEHFLSLEFSDRNFFPSHALTVLTYSLQHPSVVSLEGWLHIRTLLRELLDGRFNPDEARSLIRRRFSIDQRDWRFGRGPRLALPAEFGWQRTIFSVCAASPEEYGRGVRAWANAVLADAERIGPQNDQKG